MKERPILFSYDMVNAIREGRKTQTRRVIKPQPAGSSTWLHYDDAFYPNNYDATPPFLKCPYGVPGDLLWVRETFSPWSDEATRLAMRSDEPCVYRADYVEQAEPLDLGGDNKWHPSIYMPRKFSRILLKVTDVRVERVQETSKGDAQAEGIVWNPGVEWTLRGKTLDNAYQSLFADLWNSINEKPREAKRNPYTNQPELCQVAYPWEDIREETVISKKSSKFDGCKTYIVGNPYVWAVTFSVDKERSIL